MSEIKLMSGDEMSYCPECGASLIATPGEDEGDGPWWCVECGGCDWSADGVSDLTPFTVAGAPWSAELWWTIDRLQRALYPDRVKVGV